MSASDIVCIFVGCLRNSDEEKHIYRGLSHRDRELHLIPGGQIWCFSFSRNKIDLHRANTSQYSETFYAVDSLYVTGRRRGGFHRHLHQHGAGSHIPSAANTRAPDTVLSGPPVSTLADHHNTSSGVVTRPPRQLSRRLLTRRPAHHRRAARPAQSDTNVKAIEQRRRANSERGA